MLQRQLDGGGSALSPLTREELGPSLVPNINLRKRIREYDSELEHVARMVLDSDKAKRQRGDEDGEL